jgi:O-antigen/teichoic acid export membrane protein
MSSVKKNLFANIVGNIWQAIMAIAFVPLYIKFMGIESWGLVGIFATLQAMSSQLDMGLSSALIREISKLSTLVGMAQRIRNFVRTLEFIYWGIALLVVILILLASHYIAYQWVNPGSLSVEVIQNSIMIMSVILAFQMLIGFYSGGLLGLQNQVVLNVINVSMSTLRSLGALFLLYFVSPTIQTFFIWQLIVSVLNLLIIYYFLWNKLPKSQSHPSFEKEHLKEIWKFSAGMSLNSILSSVLLQMDKIVLSRLLTLEQFGFYTLASTVAMSLGRLFTPVYLSIYPKFSQLIYLNDIDKLKNLYHKSSQFMSVLIIPIAVIVSLFSYQILFLWTQNQNTAENSYIILIILICGTTFNGIMHPPYALQIAYGWTSLSVYGNMIALIVLIPLLFYLTSKYGVIGGALPWLLLNLGYFIITIPFMHIKILKHEKWKWYLQDIGIPLFTCLLVAILGRLFFNSHMSNKATFVYIFFISFLTFLIATLITPVTRSYFFKTIYRFRAYVNSN